MAVSPLDLLQRQAENAVRREVGRQSARVRRELSLVDQVRRMSGRAERAVQDAGRSLAEAARRPQEAPELEELDPPGEGSRAQPGAVVCADGYVRRSPVQPYRKPKDRRWARRLIAVALLAVLALLLSMALWKSGLVRLNLF